MTWGIFDKRNPLRAYGQKIASKSFILGAILVSSIVSSAFTSMHPAYAAPVNVTVTITRVIETSCSTLELDCPNDYYAKISIDGLDYLQTGEITSTDFSPENWSFEREVDPSSGTIPIVIQLWDSDTFFDDQVDIDPREGGSDLDLTFDLASGTWSGDVPDSQKFAEGNEGGNTAKIFFDIILTSDTDGDGLLDSWELNGFDSNGDGIIDVDLPAFGANRFHKDLFLELDWMIGDEPRQEEVQAVKHAFSLAPISAGGIPNPDGQLGINLWIDTGGLSDPRGSEDGVATCSDGIDNNANGLTDLVDESTCLFPLASEGNASTCNDNIDNGGDGLTDLADPSCLVGDNLGGGNAMASLATNGIDTNFYNAKAANFDVLNRAWIFRYAISADHCTTCPGGQGEKGGNDFIDYNHNAGTLMHELGHNLNLHHGGDESTICKPDYVSLMDYDEAGGFSQKGGTRIIDYSPPRLDNTGNLRGVAPLGPLDETELDEGTILDATDNVNDFVFANALGQKVRNPLSQPVDWNGDGDKNDSDLTVNIDNSSVNGNPKDCTNDVHDTDVTGYDDWSHISLPFRHFGESADGPINPDTGRDPTMQEIFDLQQELDTTDLQLTIEDSADPAVAGEELDYTIVVSNNGPNPADVVSVTDTLPEGVSYVGSSTTSCLEGPAGTITCPVGSLQATESGTISIKVIVDADLVYLAGKPVTITNSASVVNLSGPDSDASNNIASAETQIAAVTDLEITSFVSSTPAEAVIGKSFEINLTKDVVNNGPSSPVDVNVNVGASVSAGVTIDPTSASSSLTALATGSGAAEVKEHFTAGCKAPGFQEFEFVNTVAPINAEDPNLENNKAELTANVECVIPVQINIQPGSDPNSVNLKSKTGLIPIAILTTTQGEYGLPIAIDATKVDPLSVRFGPASVLLGVDPPGGAPEYHNTGHILKSLEMDEKTRDGDNDMELHFDARKTGLKSGDTAACAKGQIAISGTWYTFYGCDAIKS